MKNLSVEARYWFAELGSKEIWGLGYRMGFVFIAGPVLGSETENKTVVSEKVALKKENTVMVSKIFQIQNTNPRIPEEPPLSADDQPENIRNFVRPKKLDIDFYLSKNSETQAKLPMFLTWCQKEGIIMPKLEYPAYFGEGNRLLGIRAREDIKNRESFIYVPWKMLLTVSKV